MGGEGGARPSYIPGWYYGPPEGTAFAKGNAFVRGEGMIVFLEDGTRIEDWEGLSLVNNIGMGRAEMAKVLSEQAQRLAFLPPSQHSDVRAALTEDLQAILPPGISTPFYSIGGADSIEAAIRAARKVTRRKKVLAFTGGFHGDTMTTESVSGWGVVDYGDPRPWIVHVPSPLDCFQERDGWDGANDRCLEGVQKALKKHGPGTFACVLVEPVTGVGGVVPISAPLSKGLRELCDKYGMKLIADEVVTGFGRTGEWFGSTSVGLKPDAMVLAKGMTGGYAPLGAAVFERSWGEELLESGFPHGPTFGGHPLGCAAARETIRILKTERLVERAKAVGAYMKRRLVELGRQHPAVVHDVRGVGLLLAIEFIADRPSSHTGRARRLAHQVKAARGLARRRLAKFGQDPLSVVRDVRSASRLLSRGLGAASPGREYGVHPASSRVWAVWEGLRRDGIRVWTSGDSSSIMFCPPFIVTEAKVDRLVDRLDAHFRAILQANGVPTSAHRPEVS